MILQHSDSWEKIKTVTVLCLCDYSCICVEFTIKSTFLLNVIINDEIKSDKLCKAAMKKYYYCGQ